MMQKFFSILISITFLLTSSLSASWYRTQKRRKNLYLSINTGLTSMQNGYDNYEDYYYFGGDLYIFVEPGIYRLGRASWKDNFFYRVSLEYFPLIVPNGVYNTCEDIYSFTGDMLYPFYKNRKETFRSFIGLGVGGYIDYILTDTPATGKVSATNFFFGLKGSIGMAMNISKYTLLVPEVRLHYMYTVDGYMASHMTYQMGLCWYWK